ncbi:hypothetical protein ACFVJ8_04015 [Streptomyces yangpuensis]|uniref:hypothetical protein n=1 Tax=Streptomyces yangpuensis TaxID=1648182 RepID=UPI00362CF820
MSISTNPAPPTSAGAAPTVRPAVYIRHSPRDPRAARHHREALQSFAARLGLPAPAVYVDTGRTSGGLTPLERLVRSVHNGSHRIILVPGTSVFSADDTQARKIVRLLSRAGASRILALPPSHRWPRYTTPVTPSPTVDEQEGDQT